MYNENNLRRINQSYIGFDNLLNNIVKLSNTSVNNFPPYNIEKLSDDNFRVSVAVAGYNKDEINVQIDKNQLLISAEVDNNENTNYLYKGIAHRKFNVALNLSEYVFVDSAKLENGILTINLIRELPEKLKPRIITIT